MQWETKARIQRLCAALPVGGDSIYYSLQRFAGGLRQSPHPEPWLRAAVEIAGDLVAAGTNLEGARLVEVGTGRGLEMPAGFHLMGAGRIDTYDLHTLLADWRIEGLLQHLVRDAENIARLLGQQAIGGAPAVRERIRRLTAGSPGAREAMRRLDVHYHAPADAAKTGLPASSVDGHFSFTVFEHIPEPILVDILREAGRILSPRGVAVHHVDLSDHYAHHDPSITAVNFLRYTQAEWDQLAGNRFAYHNRLRVKAMHAVYAQAGHQILSHTDWTDPGGLAALRAGLPLAPQFSGQPIEELAMTGIRVVSRAQTDRTRANSSAKRGDPGPVRGLNG